MHKQAESAVGPLTRREREVLALLAQGHSAPEIAQSLTLALSTVKFHLENLYGKLGANSKRQALERARGLGLLPTHGHPASSEPPPARHNLPHQFTRFFGREAELTQIGDRLAENRLVTLSGIGGVGKTRLALRAAEALLPNYADGVWFVELAALSDPDLVPQQVASTLGLRDLPGQPVLETLTRALRPRQTLMLLDNCEHVLEGCAGLCAALLRACPNLRVLACSREPLGVAGEVILLVPSLPFPETGQLRTAHQLGDYAAVRLFTDRARLVRPDYEVAAHNAAAVAGIVRRVDGIPLAIEMAAARLNTLSAEQLVVRLDDAFRLLTSGSRTALPRQQTLRATIDWSYQLLNPAEQALLQRLSVFAGGCTLEAAEAVCSDEGLPAAEILNGLAGLVAKSVVIAERQPGDPTRYCLLEMVRQYAREKLAAGFETSRLRLRHRDYYLAFAEANAPQFGFPDRRLRAKRLQAERDNFRLALEWSFSDLSEADAAPRLTIAMYALWPSVGESLEWCKRCLELCRSRTDIPEHLYARLLCIASSYTALNDPATALALVQESVAVSRRIGSAGHKTLIQCLCLLGWRYLRDLHDVANALAPYQEAEELFETLGPNHYEAGQYAFWRAWFAGIRANLALEQGRYPAAKAYAAESIRQFEAGGNSCCFQHADARIYLGAAHLYLSEYTEARQQFLEAIGIATALGDDQGDNRRNYALYWLALLHLRWGSLDQALEYAHTAIRQCSLVPDYNIIAVSLGVCVEIAAAQSQPRRAATLSGAAQAMIARQGRGHWEDFSLDRFFPGWRDQPDHAALQGAFEAGQRLTNEQAVAVVLADPVT